MPEYIPGLNLGPETSLYEQANQMKAQMGGLNKWNALLGPMLDQMGQSASMPKDLVRNMLGSFTGSAGQAAGSGMVNQFLGSSSVGGGGGGGGGGLASLGAMLMM